MPFKNLANIIDKDFDAIYPQHIQKLSNPHWTPINICIEASKFLAINEKTKILDIGSGVGKFCFIGASTTQSQYIGIEQRKELIEISNVIVRKYLIENVNFINDNIININFNNYDCFYFGNPFFENLKILNVIDESIQFSKQLYLEYNTYVKKQLLLTKPKTKLATFCDQTGIVPKNFKLIESKFGETLKLWEKI